MEKKSEQQQTFLHSEKSETDKKSVPYVTLHNSQFKSCKYEKHRIMNHYYNVFFFLHGSQFNLCHNNLKTNSNKTTVWKTMVPVIPVYGLHNMHFPWFV